MLHRSSDVPHQQRDEQNTTETQSRPITAPFSFLLAATILVPIAPEARLTLFDLVAVLLILHYRSSVMNVFRPTIIVMVISLAAMIVSANLHGSEMRALIGRAYQIVALVVEMIGFFLLLWHTDDRGRSAATFGAMAGMCCHYFYPSDLRVITEPIKFLLGIPLGVGLLALYALTVKRATATIAIAAVLMVAYAGFCLFVGSRSIGGVYFVSALLVVSIGAIRIPTNYAKLAPLLIVVIALAGYAVTELYTALAIGGYFGDRAAGIAAFQSSYGSILLGGRPEIIVNMSGIKDAPIFGSGILNYPSLYIYEMINLSIYTPDVVLDLSNILYHSAIFATAFESGIFSAMLYAGLLYRALFCIPLLKNLAVAQRAFAMPLVLITVWHLLFSPPIPYNRFVMSIGMAIVFFVYHRWRQTRDLVAA
ncbi:MAG: hypothetical protein EOO77_14495 [Oxalobacteraceae bacterium]|nr:MAG: hypothetical protein EOO77_14495 [Oxalobacteraceae bacterium]